MLPIFDIAGSALTAQSARLNAVASNIANVDSTVTADGSPYRAKQVVFQATPMAGSTQTGPSVGVRVIKVVESTAPFRMQYDPANPAADAQGYVKMPNVNIVDETTNMISASRSYQSNVEVFNTAKSLMLKTLNMGQ